jgi:uncharacterized membrane protein YjfL (UPF0719 family)
MNDDDGHDLVEEPGSAPYVRAGESRGPAAQEAAEKSMQIPIVAMNFGYAVLGVVLMYLTYRVFDILTPQVDFHDELKKGNVAVAIFLGAIFIAIGMIVGRALN